MMRGLQVQTGRQAAVELGICNQTRETFGSRRDGVSHFG